MNILIRIAILRCEKLPAFVNWEVPSQILETLFDEDNLLIRGFEAQGFKASSVVWDDSNIDWNQFDIALIRSTWDYIDKPELFLKVLNNIESSSCRLFNPLEAVSWNMDKNYLFDLEKWGVPIVPTYLLSDNKPGTLQKLFMEKQWESVILKPTIGLGASYTYRVSLDELSDTINKVKNSHPDSEYLIQPFIEDIVTEGEWSFIYFNKQLSHVLLKKPALNDYRVQETYGGTLQPAKPNADDLLHVESVLSKLPFDVLFARLDFVRVQGQLSIMEFELIEPVFSFNLVPESIERLVKATRNKYEMLQ